MKPTDEYNTWEQEQRLYLTNGTSKDRQASSNSEIPMANITQTPLSKNMTGGVIPSPVNPITPLESFFKISAALVFTTTGQPNWRLSMIS